MGRLLLYLISFLTGSALVWFSGTELFLSAYSAQKQPTSLFQVNNKDNLQTICKRLEKKKFLKHWFSAYTIAKLLNDEEQNKLKKITVAEYKLSPSMTPKEILQEFLDRKFISYEYTIPEGATLKEIARIIAKSKLFKEEEIANNLYRIRKIVQPQLFNLGLTTKSFEGYMSPGTYKFTRPITPSEIIKHMYEEGKKKIPVEYKNRAKELALSFSDVMILASILEKETSLAKERAIISSVFHNRLRIGMPLQSESTLKYALPKINGALTKEHLRTNSPYNTFLNTGLPPTPICSPSLESIKAALYPKNSEYVYFLNKNDGSGEHYFSSTYKEHQKAKRVFKNGHSPSILMQEIVKQEQEQNQPTVEEILSRTRTKPSPPKSPEVNKTSKEKKKKRKPWRPFSQLDPVRGR